MTDGNGNGDSRLVLANGRRPLGKSGDYITRKQAEELVMRERAENENMVKWYMRQIPELVARMLGDALAVNGLVMKAPVTSEVPQDGVSAEKSRPETESPEVPPVTQADGASTEPAP